MKQFASLVLAGIIGALFTVGLLKIDKEKSLIETDSKAVYVNHDYNAAPSSLPTDFISAAERATPAVVHIHAKESNALANQRYEKERQQQRRYRTPFDDFFGFEDFFGRNFYQPKQGSGSGVIVSEDGYIVTNNHVVEFADEILITLNDGKEYLGEIVGTDSSTDLAIVRIEADNLPTMNFANSDRVRVGEWVLAVGNPFSYLTSTVTAGIVSAKGRDLDIIEGEKSIEEFIQTDAAVNPGNSGGALVNAQGQIIGINTAIATPTGVYAGYSFAIPSNLVQRVIKEIRENGNIERVNLGIQGFDLDNDIATELDLKVSEGAYVEKVLRGSSAQYAGVLPGDVILNVNGINVISYEEIKETIKFTKVGDTLNLLIDRNGSKKTISLRLRKGI